MSQKVEVFLARGTGELCFVGCCCFGVKLMLQQTGSSCSFSPWDCWMRENLGTSNEPSEGFCN